ncbi:hypothetical protein D3C73_1552050 [compost metagenome]
MLTINCSPIAEYYPIFHTNNALMTGSSIIRHYSLYLFAFHIPEPFHKSAIQRLQ